MSLIMVSISVLFAYIITVKFYFHKQVHSIGGSLIIDMSFNYMNFLNISQNLW